VATESNSPSVTVERPRDFHVVRSDKLPSPMNPISSLLAARKQRVSGVDMFKTLQKRAADYRSTENNRVLTLVQRIGYDLLRRNPTFLSSQGFTDPMQWAQQLAKDPEKLGVVLAAYGAKRGNPALQELGSTFLDSAAPGNQAEQRGTEAAGRGAAVDLVGNFGDAIVKDPMLSVVMNTLGTVASPMIQIAPTLRRFAVNRESFGPFLDHLDATMDYDDARDAVSTAQRHPTDPAVLAGYQKTLADTQRRAVQTGGQVLKPEYRAGSMGDAPVAAAGFAGDLTSAILSPALAPIGQVLPQGITDISRALGKNIPEGATAGEQQYNDIFNKKPGEDPRLSRLWSYGHGLGRGAAIANAATNIRAAGSLKGGLPGLIAAIGAQGVVNTAQGLSTKGQEAINNQQVQNAMARESGQESGTQQFIRDAVLKTPTAMLGLTPASETQGAYADVLNRLGAPQSPEVTQVQAAIRDKMDTQKAYAAVYPGIAKIFAGTKMDPSVVDTLATEAAQRLQTGTNPLVASNLHSEQAKSHLQGKLTATVVSGDLANAVKAGKLSQAQASALAPLVQLAPTAMDHIVQYAGDPEVAPLLAGVTPVALPQLHEFNAQTGKPEPVTSATTARWDPAVKQWVNDDFIRAAKSQDPALQQLAHRMEASGIAAHGDQPDRSPSTMIAQQNATDADPQSPRNLALASYARENERRRGISDRVNTTKRESSEGAWDDRKAQLDKLFNRIGTESQAALATHKAYSAAHGVDPEAMTTLLNGPVPAVGRDVQVAGLNTELNPSITGLPKTNPGGQTFGDPRFHPSQPGWQESIAQAAKGTPAPAPVITAVPKIPKLGSAFVLRTTAQGLAWWTP